MRLCEVGSIGVGLVESRLVHARPVLLGMKTNRPVRLLRYFVYLRAVALLVVVGSLRILVCVLASSNNVVSSIGWSLGKPSLIWILFGKDGHNVLSVHWLMLMAHIDSVVVLDIGIDLSHDVSNLKSYHIFL